ncbi:uncharacterized protein A1O5_00431 [Cladophialophora psammophila CBS 110553]|uniref:Zn(2)-C6 fungal-type domain-containing protein n=1 Tax=Cladophialophora psammophila CBS 110553 TaxID=1182543 RepID=W9X6V1_9EURO|nr:uncharacterized protein A1O5_00431 [Cladophialophora psammophila CBS 110553]EXJ75923.1 hypothetical protein A1O5_00431 [Cladophialophora psammophila CBS 110553]
MGTQQDDIRLGPVIPKRVRACDFCRAKKIRCVGDNPCSNCIEHGAECIFAPRQPRRKRKRDGLPDSAVAHPLDRFQDLVEAARASSNDSNQLSDVLSRKTSHLQQEERAHQLVQSNCASGQRQRRLSEVTRQKHQPAFQAGQFYRAVGESLDFPRSDRGNQRRRGLPPPATKSPSQFGSSEAPWERFESPNQSTTVDSPQDTGGYHTFKEDIEFWGPRTSMSICSLAGIAWVTERVKQPDFRPIANRFTQDVARRLKLEKRPSKERKGDPDLKDALRFTSAYFEEAPEAALGIVRRSCLESRLRSFYNGSKSDDDASWYAMRNIIFASGCRVVLSRGGTYSEAQRESWLYFENALSVHAELLCFRTSVMGVQALTLMAYFAEAVSCRMLQYILVANAYRLACGQGLHVQPAPSWNLPEEEKSLRQCIFWAIYCLDKQIACRSGRPSIIDDEEINCQLPTCDRSDGSVNVRYIQACIKINHLSSVMRKMLFKAAAWRQAPEELVNNVGMLQKKLEELRVSLRDQCQINLPMNLTKPPAGLNMQQALSIQFLHHNLAWDIHTTLAHPWFRGVTGLDRHPDFQGQIAESCSIVAETSRAAILDCRFIHVDASCPMPVAYYTPLYAVVNIFINILYDPSLASARSDLHLMEVASGYFARLEYVTDSQWSVPLVKDTTTLARNAVESFSGGPDHPMHPQENSSTASTVLPSLEPLCESALDETGVGKEVRSP